MPLNSQEEGVQLLINAWQVEGERVSTIHVLPHNCQSMTLQPLM